MNSDPITRLKTELQEAERVIDSVQVRRDAAQKFLSKTTQTLIRHRDNVSRLHSEIASATKVKDSEMLYSAELELQPSQIKFKKAREEIELAKREYNSWTVTLKVWQERIQAILKAIEKAESFNSYNDSDFFKEPKPQAPKPQSSTPKAPKKPVSTLDMAEKWYNSTIAAFADRPSLTSCTVPPGRSCMKVDCRKLPPTLGLCRCGVRDIFGRIDSLNFKKERLR